MRERDRQFEDAGESPDVGETVQAVTRPLIGTHSIECEIEPLTMANLRDSIADAVAYAKRHGAPVEAIIRISYGSRYLGLPDPVAVHGAGVRHTVQVWWQEQRP